MTTARYASITATLMLALGCAANEQSNLTGDRSATGGSATETTGGTTATEETAAGGDSAAGAGGTTAASSVGGAATETSTVPTVTTRCSDANTGELTFAHTSPSGQSNGFAGATVISAGSVTSFLASDIALKFCFSVLGSVTLSTTAGMIVDSASVSGGSVNYVNLSGTPLTIEATDETNRYCIVFNVGSAPGLNGVTVTGVSAVTYNWRFNEGAVDVGLMFDPRQKNVPELKVLLKGSVVACQVVTS